MSCASRATPHARHDRHRRVGARVRARRGVRAGRPGEPGVAGEQRVVDAARPGLRDEQRAEQALRMTRRRDDGARAHGFAQTVLPQRAPEERLRDEDQRIGDAGRVQVGRRRRALRVVGPREQVQAVAVAPGRLARRRADRVSEPGGRDGQAVAQRGPLRDERRELRQRVGSLSRECHGRRRAAREAREERGRWLGRRGGGRDRRH